MNSSHEQELRAMNEALLVASVRQHELAEQARNAEAAAREKEERFRALFELDPVAIYSCDQAGVIQEFNRRAVELWGREPAVGDTDERFCGSFKLFRPDGTSMPHGQRPMAAVLSGRTPEVRNEEVLIERPDGSRLTVLENIRPLKNGRGEVTGVINCFCDITERQLAEEARGRLAAIIESSADAIMGITLDGIITSWNRSAERMFGHTETEALGRHVSLIIPDERRSELEEVLARLRRGETVDHFETERQAKDGRRVSISLSVSPIKNAAGKIIGASKVSHDITKRRLLERKTQEQAEALADLHRRKDEFLAMLSHELRNPLAPIANAVHLLRLRKNEDPLQQRAQMIIERQVAQMTRLIDDLMEVSRITTGRVHLRFERVAVAGVVDRAVETARPLMDQRRHELTVSAPAEPLFLRADATRLEQVIVNLLTNAAKYTDEGGHVWLTFQQESEECVLRVRDTGVGIAPELLPRIFELFTQAERSLARSQGGLGIGLALVHRLVEMHGGKVEVYSALGQGSEFVVRVPMARFPELTSPATQVETTETACPTLRILVVDDNEDAAESLALLLRASRHEVRTAYEGLAALTAAREHRPHVVLLDIGLPGLDGYEVARRMRQDPALKDSTLAALTGYGRESDLQKSQEAGFDHHLLKPVDLAKLQQVLKTVSAKATRRSAAVAERREGHAHDRKTTSRTRR